MHFVVDIHQGMANIDTANDETWNETRQKKNGYVSLRFYQYNKSQILWL